MTCPSILAIAMASPITIFRKAWELRNHKVAALKDVPMSEQKLLSTTQRKKLCTIAERKRSWKSWTHLNPTIWLKTGRMGPLFTEHQRPSLRARDHLSNLMSCETASTSSFASVKCCLSLEIAFLYCTAKSPIYAEFEKSRSAPHSQCASASLSMMKARMRENNREKESTSWFKWRNSLLLLRCS
jgi:hypothetical protein